MNVYSLTTDKTLLAQPVDRFYRFAFLFEGVGKLLYLEIVERYLELILGRETCVTQITVDMSPFL